MIALFVFYSRCSPKIQRFLSFSKNIRHTSVILYDGKQSYLTEFVRQGIKIKVFPVDDIKNIIDMMKKMPTVEAIISTFITDRAIIKWWPFSINSCNELDRKVSGIDIGLTLNPKHMYNKLLKYDGCTNYRIDYKWRKSDGR
jgi:hypothetical protein